MKSLLDCNDFIYPSQVLQRESSTAGGTSYRRVLGSSGHVGSAGGSREEVASLPRHPLLPSPTLERPSNTTPPFPLSNKQPSDKVASSCIMVEIETDLDDPTAATSVDVPRKSTPSSSILKASRSQEIVRPHSRSSVFSADSQQVDSEAKMVSAITPCSDKKNFQSATDNNYENHPSFRPINSGIKTISSLSSEQIHNEQNPRLYDSHTDNLDAMPSNSSLQMVSILPSCSDRQKPLDRNRDAVKSASILPAETGPLIPRRDNDSEEIVRRNPSADSGISLDGRFKRSQPSALLGQVRSSEIPDQNNSIELKSIRPLNPIV